MEEKVSEGITQESQLGGLKRRRKIGLSSGGSTNDGVRNCNREQARLTRY